MRCNPVLLTGLFVLVITSTPFAAWADIPPPPDDETCTATQQELPGTTCETCRDDSTTNCAADLGSRGYAWVCTNEYYLYDLWCDGQARDSGGCAATSTAAAGLVGILLLAGGLARRRSGRNR